MEEPDFRSDIREQFEELGEEHGLEPSDFGGMRSFAGDDVVFVLQGTRIDFGTGRIVGTVRVSGPRTGTTIECERMNVGPGSVTFHGRHDGEVCEVLL